MRIKANIVDVHSNRIYAGELSVAGGRIVSIVPTGLEDPCLSYVLPGFVDSHVHIESSMMLPDAYAACAAKGGLVGCVTDPHEIANVLGVNGVLYMMENARNTPFHIMFGAPSCVPATSMETSGAVLSAREVGELLALPEVGFLSEVMNFPAVVAGEPDMAAKIDAARRLGKPIDGHAPGLGGFGLEKYASCGISTDHECSTIDEAREKVRAGMMIQIREGSAAKNFEALLPLVDESPHSVMFCTDDSHPDYLVTGPIRAMVSRAVKAGCDLWNVLGIACVNPVVHYGLGVGLLREGDPADFIIVRDLNDFDVVGTVISGVVYDSENPLPVASREGIDAPNNFVEGLRLSPSDIALRPRDPRSVEAMVAYDGSLITGRRSFDDPCDGDGFIHADVSRDLLKIVAQNRYVPGASPAVGLITGFGFKRGAIAASVAHDSHNIVAVGADDESICRAVNAVAEMKGGYAVVCGDDLAVLPLPVAGLMSLDDSEAIIPGYNRLKKMAREDVGCPFADPFMTLSFMALPVIPELKMTDRGLFDFALFSHISL